MIKGVLTSLLSFVLFTAILSGFSDFSPDNVGMIFEDIYNNADSETQKDVMGKFDNNCKLILAKSDYDPVKALQDLCFDEEKMDNLVQSCKMIEILATQLTGSEISQLKQTCTMLESGELQRQCENIESIALDTSELESVCRTKGQISDGKFFSDMAMSLMPEDTIENNMHNSPLGKMQNFLDLIEKYWIIILIVDLILLYLVYRSDIRSLIYTMGKSLQSVGTMIIVPFVLLKIYLMSTTIDTSFILSGIINGAVPQDLIPQALKTLLPIILTKMFSPPMLIAGGLFLIIGVLLRIFTKKTQEPINPNREMIREHLETIEKEQSRNI